MRSLSIPSCIPPYLLLLPIAIACAESNSKLTDGDSSDLGGNAGVAGDSGISGKAQGGQPQGGGGTTQEGGSPQGGNESGGAGNGGSTTAGVGGSNAGQGGSTTAGHGGNGDSGAGSPQGGSAGEESGGSGGATCVGKIVINEISPEGETGNDDFVELYNPESCPVDISGWTLVYVAATSTAEVKYWTANAGQQIPAKGFWVLGTKEFSGSSDGKLISGLKQTGGGVGLKTENGTLIDSVAWGNASKQHPLIEGTVCKAIPPNQSAARIPDGSDTNNNATDFKTPSTRSPGKPNF